MLFPTSLTCAFLPLKVNEELRAMTKSCESFDSEVMRSSEMPSAKYSCSASPLMLAKGRTAIDGLSSAAADGASEVGVDRLRRAGSCGWPDVEGVDAQRLGDVLELDRAEITRLQIEPPLHLPI